MRWLWLLLISLLLINPVQSLEVEKGVRIPIVADYRTPEGGEEGVLLGATVVVLNGTGHVFVDTRPYTQVDLQGSARLAAMVASEVLGVDQSSYDFYYIIDVSSPIIGGPSAGGALTVATIAAIENWTINPSVVMTGMINPDESIGPVGGIPFKLEAAAQENATFFLIPEGQTKVPVTRTVETRRGAFVYRELKTEMVDVAELGKSLGVQVREVGTIQEAVFYFTGREIGRPIPSEVVLTPKYLETLEPLATKLKNEAHDMFKATTSKDKLLDRARANLENADKMYGDKKYYAATSLYFTSMFYLRTIQWLEGYNAAKDREQFLAGLEKEVIDQINISETEISRFKMDGVSDVEAVGAAESRVSTARAYMENAKESSDPQEYIGLMAFARERARSAGWWLTLAIPGPTVSREVLMNRAGWYLGQAQSIYTYALELLSETGVSSDLLQEASRDLSQAQGEIQRGYYAGAIFDSLQATVKASTVIGSLGAMDMGKKVEQSTSAARLAISDARALGIEPILAVSAYEYAETLGESQDKIVQYSYAKMVAKTSVALSTANISRPMAPFLQITPRTPRPTAPTPTPAETPSIPGFEAALGVLIILVGARFIRR